MGEPQRKVQTKVLVRFCDRCMKQKGAEGVLSKIGGAVARPKDAVKKRARVVAGAVDATVGEASQWRSTSLVPAMAQDDNPRNRGVSMAWVKPAESYDNRSHWVPDHSRDNCKICKQAFGMFRWRHHCRQCGNLVCDACSQGRNTQTQYR